MYVCMHTHTVIIHESLTDRAYLLPLEQGMLCSKRNFVKIIMEYKND